MKKFTVPTQEKATNEGHTQVELATEIRLRAYKLYEQRGREDGHALEDWVQAEAEILEAEQRPVAA
jgi:hypothetical protein